MPGPLRRRSCVSALLTLLLGAPACAPSDYEPEWSVGSYSGDLELLGADCWCAYSDREREAQIVCDVPGQAADGPGLVLWIPTAPRDHERAVRPVWLWVTEPGERCDYYGHGVAESWIGAPVEDPTGSTSTRYRPLYVRRFLVPAQTICQGDGIRCFDYGTCVDWQESAADEMRFWCRESLF